MDSSLDELKDNLATYRNHPIQNLSLRFDVCETYFTQEFINALTRNECEELWPRISSKLDEGSQLQMWFLARLQDGEAPIVSIEKKRA